MRDLRMTCSASALEVLGTDEKVAKLIRSCTVLMQRTDLTPSTVCPIHSPCIFKRPRMPLGAATLTAESSSYTEGKDMKIWISWGELQLRTSQERFMHIMAPLLRASWTMSWHRGARFSSNARSASAMACGLAFSHPPSDLVIKFSIAANSTESCIPSILPFVY